MNVLLFESIAFGISVIGFVYGLITVFMTDSPLYFRTIISAVGCYALEELWVIVDVLTDAEDAVVSVRLIGIFGCFCAFLTASRILNKVLFDKGQTKICIPAVLVSVIFMGLVVLCAVLSAQTNPVLTPVLTCAILLPPIVDSYYECRQLAAFGKEDARAGAVRPIALLVLLEYAISIAYILLHTRVLVGLSLDVLSAVVMALMVMFCRKGAAKWKT